MHPEVYQRNPNQICFFEQPKDGTAVVCCRKSTMFGMRWSGRHLTPEQNREHQANTIAAFTAMPRQTLISVSTGLIRDAGTTGSLPKARWRLPLFFNHKFRNFAEFAELIW